MGRFYFCLVFRLDKKDASQFVLLFLLTQKGFFYITNTDNLKILNQENIDAINEIKELKNNSDKKVYPTLLELLKDIDII